MSVKVLLADDAEIMRRAIRNLLSEAQEIEVVGEAATLPEMFQKSEELKPNVVVLDLHMADHANVRLLAGPKVLAISLANDDEAKASAQSMGAVRLLDKMNLGQQLIPAILELTTTGSGV